MSGSGPSATKNIYNERFATQVTNATFVNGGIQSVTFEGDGTIFPQDLQTISTGDSGDFKLTLNSVGANEVLIGPVNGTGPPTYRTLNFTNGNGIQDVTFHGDGVIFYDTNTTVSAGDSGSFELNLKPVATGKFLMGPESGVGPPSYRIPTVTEVTQDDQSWKDYLLEAIDAAAVAAEVVQQIATAGSALYSFNGFSAGGTGSFNPSWAVNSAGDVTQLGNMSISGPLIAFANIDGVFLCECSAMFTGDATFDPQLSKNINPNGPKNPDTGDPEPDPTTFKGSAIAPHWTGYDEHSQYRVGLKPTGPPAGIGENSGAQTSASSVLTPVDSEFFDFRHMSSSNPSFRFRDITGDTDSGLITTGQISAKSNIPGTAITSQQTTDSTGGAAMAALNSGNDSISMGINSSGANVNPKRAFVETSDDADGLDLIQNNPENKKIRLVNSATNSSDNIVQGEVEFDGFQLNANNIWSKSTFYTTSYLEDGTNLVPINITYSSTKNHVIGGNYNAVILPSTATPKIQVGQSFIIMNNSTTDVMVKYYNNVLIHALPSHSVCEYILIAKTDLISNWFFSPSIASSDIVLPLKIEDGGTGVAAVTTVPVPTMWAGWDANSYLTATNYRPGAVSNVLTDYVMDATSPYLNVLYPGTTNVYLPPVNTFDQFGLSFYFVNYSGAPVTIYSGEKDYTYSQIAGQGPAGLRVTIPLPDGTEVPQGDFIVITVFQPNINNIITCINWKSSVVLNTRDPEYKNVQDCWRLIDQGPRAIETGIIQIDHGGTGVTSLSSTQTADSVALWDEHRNMNADNFIPLLQYIKGSIAGVTVDSVTPDPLGIDPPTIVYAATDIPNYRLSQNPSGMFVVVSDITNVVLPSPNANSDSTEDSQPLTIGLSIQITNKQDTPVNICHYNYNVLYVLGAGKTNKFTYVRYPENPVTDGAPVIQPFDDSLWAIYNDNGLGTGSTGNEITISPSNILKATATENGTKLTYSGFSLPVSSGGTGQDVVMIQPIVNQDEQFYWAGWDSSGFFNAINYGADVTSFTANTTNIDINRDGKYKIISNDAIETVTLPNVNDYLVGFSWTINNDKETTTKVRTYNGSTVYTLIPGETNTFTLIRSLGSTSDWLVENRPQLFSPDISIGNLNMRVTDQNFLSDGTVTSTILTNSYTGSPTIIYTRTAINGQDDNSKPMYLTSVKGFFRVDNYNSPSRIIWDGGRIMFVLDHPTAALSDATGTKYQKVTVGLNQKGLSGYNETLTWGGVIVPPDSHNVYADGTVLLIAESNGTTLYDNLVYGNVKDADNSDMWTLDFTYFSI